MLSVKNRVWLLKQSCRLLDSSIIFGGEKTHWWCQRCNIFPCKSHFPPLSLLWLTFSVVTWDSVGKPAALWQRIAGMKISHAGIFSRLFGVRAVFGANNESENKNGNVEKGDLSRRNSNMTAGSIRVLFQGKSTNSDLPDLQEGRAEHFWFCSDYIKELRTSLHSCKCQFQVNLPGVVEQIGNLSWNHRCKPNF